MQARRRASTRARAASALRRRRWPGRKPSWPRRRFSCRRSSLEPVSWWPGLWAQDKDTSARPQPRAPLLATGPPMGEERASIESVGVTGLKRPALEFPKESIMAGLAEKKLADLGIVLPIPASPIANYVGFVRSGTLLFVSGQVCLEPGGKLLAKGKLGQNVST